MAIEHPYKKYENSVYWEVVEKAIEDLFENQDIREITTPLEYIVGYILKCLDDANLLVK